MFSKVQNCWGLGGHYKKGQVIVFFGPNSEENDNELIHDLSKKYANLRDYWISKIKNITKNCCYLMVSGESIPKNHLKKIFVMSET